MAGSVPCGNFGDIDWNEVWKARQDRSDAARIAGDTSHDWDRKENAERYAAQSRGEFEKRIQMTLDDLADGPSTRVLDIGAGPGTLAIPLAPRVKEITAVEPGAGMIAALEDRAGKEGIRNITMVRKIWEEVDPVRDLDGPYDLVIASLSLTMHDIREAVLKMDAASCGEVCLYWFVDLPFWEQMYADLMVPLHGRPYFSGPKADCLWNVLFQAGIYADVRMLPLDKEYRFSSRDEMTAFFKKRFGVTTAGQELVLENYLSGLIRTEENTVVISGTSTFAKIWWKKGN
ncbi:class I SAM-dependent methyltransferase [Methanoregula sp.]|uniref:class I SAM-dependent methyltransferase n=1 Tax=Methanoregula sp. TaxID=2052170 RepID=UPI002C28D019|nr:methyltransferase domain-containing protein [Methanoregula sp.]HVP95756.1 methyltransferase domain-containing protein [Methanoregula sp.]